MKRMTTLFARPTLTLVAVEPVHIQLFEQLIVCGPMFELPVRPQQDKAAFVGGHSHASLKERSLLLFGECRNLLRGSHLDHLL